MSNSTVCDVCGDSLTLGEVVTDTTRNTGWQHPVPGRDHPPRPAPATAPDVSRQLHQLAQAVTGLHDIVDPTTRDRAAVALAARTRTVMHAVRVDAARQACRGDGHTPASYARTLGVSRVAVTKLLGGQQ